VRLVRVLTGPAPAHPLAAAAGVAVRTVRAGTFPDGVSAADDAVDSGVALLLVSGSGSADSCALATAALTGAEPVAVLPRGAYAVDTAAWIARAALVRDRRRELVALRERPDDLLHALGDAALATACGLVTRAATRRTPIVLDGELAVTAALVAHAAAPQLAEWWQVADSSGDAVQARALTALEQRPVLDFGINTADGTAALLALRALQAAAMLAARPGGAA
jgi:nicotinate-nucleotide--dimethylbenzimidazole phosphoribosyltransferase